MERQQQIKKILIILVVIGLFALSYYYYVAREQKAHLAALENAVQKGEQSNINTPVQIITTPSPVTTTEKVVEGSPSAQQEPVVAEGDSIPQTTAKIKPTDKSSLISAAQSSTGKADPFASGRGGYAPALGGSSIPSPGSDLPGLDELPPPPDFAGAAGQEASAEDRVQIKGFMDNKVIAEINGITDALAVGEKLGGVKVLKVDAANLATNFLIDGKTVAKKMPPVVDINNNAGLKPTVNLPPVENLKF
jgi:hypothetical protein